MTESTNEKPGPSSAGSKRPQPSRSLIGHLDRTISRLNIILSTPSGTDSLLRTVTYTVQFLTGALTTLQMQQTLVSAASSAALALPGSTALLALLPPAPRARALSALISDFRSFSRLWGLLGLWSLAARLLRTPPADGVLRAVAWGQCAAYIAYQALENRAYLAGKGVVALPRAGARGVLRDWLWSSRMWMVAVGLEFVRLARVAQLGVRARAAAAGSGAGAAAAEGARAEEVAQWRRDMVVNLANAPMTVHWSIEGGTLSETAVGFLGMIAGLVGFRQRWIATGKLVK
jgi:hypothetical protein